MKDIRIGNLIFNKKSILLLAFCLFINGMLIGGLVAYSKLNHGSINFIPFYVMMFLPYVICRKAISRNITEIKK